VNVILLIHYGSSLILGMIGFGFLIGIHELGHFMACKLFDVRTPSFSLGFGPQLFTKQIGETNFTLSLIPFGGYVEVAGADDAFHEHDERLITKKPYYQKLIILLGGIVVNILFAYATLTAILLRQTPATPFLSPLNISPIVEAVAPDSPASQKDIRPGDTIRSINLIPLRSSADIVHAWQATKTEGLVPIPIELEREGTLHTIHVVPTAGCSSKSIGLSFKLSPLPPHTLIESLHKSAQVIYHWARMTFLSLANMVRTRSTEGLGGPIAVMSGITTSAQRSFLLYVITLCFISTGLACINFVPLPVFDGGQILFYTLEAVTRLSLNRLRIIVHTITWAALIILMVYLSWRDLIYLIIG